MVLYLRILKKFFGLSNLQNIHKYSLEIGQGDFIENRVALSNVLSQVNSIIENHFQFAEEDIKSEYIQLRKLILVWLIECSTEPEVDNEKDYLPDENRYMVPKYITN